MPSAESFRKLAVVRVGGACEYCRLLEYAAGVTFHMEHVVPSSKGGETGPSNLALGCPGCNLAKADQTAAMDGSGQEHQLFNPRAYQPSTLGWHLHFALQRETGLILPRTTIGEVTVAALKMNSPKRSFARKLQIQAGLIA